MKNDSMLSAQPSDIDPYLIIEEIRAVVTNNVDGMVKFMISDIKVKNSQYQFNGYNKFLVVVPNEEYVKKIANNFLEYGIAVNAIKNHRSPSFTTKSEDAEIHDAVEGFELCEIIIYNFRNSSKKEKVEGELIEAINIAFGLEEYSSKYDALPTNRIAIKKAVRNFYDTLVIIGKNNISIEDSKTLLTINLEVLRSELGQYCKKTIEVLENFIDSFDSEHWKDIDLQSIRDKIIPPRISVISIDKLTNFVEQTENSGEINELDGVYFLQLDNYDSEQTSYFEVFPEIKIIKEYDASVTCIF